MRLIFNKKILSIFTAIVLASFFAKMVFATPPASFYTPGETLYPTCAPTDTNCDVAAPLTSVSVVTANGVSGTVATATTTPAITLTLGAITPTSVAATGTVTGSNLSGTNTGDQTISLTGDVTGTG